MGASTSSAKGKSTESRKGLWNDAAKSAAEASTALAKRVIDSSNKNTSQKGGSQLNETPEAVQSRKRASKRASYASVNTITEKDRQKLLLNNYAIVALNGTAFTTDMLKLHNSYRADHGVPPLKLRHELSEMAQTAAESGVAGKTDLVPHENIGENDFTANCDKVLAPSAAAACSDWYEIGSNFDYAHPRKIAQKPIRFMQMIWKDTKELEVGRAVSASGKVMIIAFYRPKAEIPSEVHNNVFPPLTVQAEIRNALLFLE